MSIAIVQDKRENYFDFDTDESGVMSTSTASNRVSMLLLNRDESSVTTAFSGAVIGTDIWDSQRYSANLVRTSLESDLNEMVEKGYIREFNLNVTENNIQINVDSDEVEVSR